MDYIDHRGHAGPSGISHAMHQFPPEKAHQPLLSELVHQLKMKIKIEIRCFLVEVIIIVLHFLLINRLPIHCTMYLLKIKKKIKEMSLVM